MNSRPVGSNKQRGFTLIELMVAGALSLMLSLVLFQVLIEAARMAETMVTRVVLNQAARETFELLAFGGKHDFAGDGVGSGDRIPGYHGRSDDPVTTGATKHGTGTVTQNTDHRLFLSQATFPAAAAFNLCQFPATTEPLLSTATVGCVAFACSASGAVNLSQNSALCEDGSDTVYVDGFVENFASSDDREFTHTTPNRDLTREITFVLRDPSRMPLFKETGYTSDEQRQSYWTVFSMQVDPP